jgi:hypothetical protein
MTPEALHALNEECIREQNDRAEYEDEKPLENWAQEDQTEVHLYTYTDTTHLEPEQEIYEAYGTADEPPDLATSLEHGGWLDVDSLPLKYEHETHPPSREYATEVDPGYDDETSAHGVAHTTHHAVEPHFDDTELFEHRNSTLWDELRAADGDWAADHEGGLEPPVPVGI